MFNFMYSCPSRDRFSMSIDDPSEPVPRAIEKFKISLVTNRIFDAAGGISFVATVWFVRSVVYR